MQCTSCRIQSNNLRAYLHASHADAAGGEVVYLCAACRVLNALHPRYVAAEPARVPTSAPALARPAVVDLRNGSAFARH